MPDLIGYDASKKRLLELLSGLLQNVRFNLFKIRSQGINTARPVAFSRGAWFVSHHLSNCTSWGPGSLSQQRKRTA